jgi:flagellar motility protein MotE (MotC chaperone)
MEMAEKDRPEDSEPKKGGSRLFSVPAKLPIDGILLVVVPFVAFVVLFLYVMGFIPAQPPIIHVVGGGLTAEAVGQTESDAQEVTIPQPQSVGEHTEGEILNEAGTAMPAEIGTVAEAEAATEIAALTDSLAGPETPGEGQLTPETTETGDALATEEREKKVKQLAKVYEQMNATSVAAIVTNMSDVEAIGILSMMNPRSAAKILATLDPERAATLSLMLTD